MFPKKTHRQINAWKDAQHGLLSEKCQSKLPWDITSHWLEWPSTKKSINSKCWRGRGERGTLLLLWWECKLIQPLENMVENNMVENNMGIPLKTRNKTIVWPNNPTTQHRPWEDAKVIQLLSGRARTRILIYQHLDWSCFHNTTSLALQQSRQENFLLNLLDHNDQTFKITCILVG